MYYNVTVDLEFIQLWLQLALVGLFKKHLLYYT